MGERAYFYVCFILLTQTPHMPLSPPAKTFGAAALSGSPSFPLPAMQGFL